MLRLLMVSLVEEIEYVLTEKWETEYRDNLLGKASLESLRNLDCDRRAINNRFEKWSDQKEK